MIRYFKTLENIGANQSLDISNYLFRFTVENVFLNFNNKIIDAKSVNELIDAKISANKKIGVLYEKVDEDVILGIGGVIKCLHDEK